MDLRPLLRHHWPDILAALALYATVLIYQGYQYGQGDQSQILPCVYAQDHPGSYPTDHYVQTYNHSPFNERTIIHFLYRYLGYNQPWIMWGWHLILSMAIILAWIRIASFFIRNKTFQWLAIGLILTLGYHTSTGSNEVYYNAVVPSLAAKAFASWAIVNWLTDRFMRCYVLLIMATLLQPLVGIQLFLLTALAYGIDTFFHKRTYPFPWKPVGLYLLFILPYWFFLIRFNGGGHDPKTFFQIIQFRLSHHFFASSFGWFNLLMGAVFFAIAVFHFKQRLKWFIVLIPLGCLVYEIGVEQYHLMSILYTQWWKTTIWMEAFAFIAIGYHLERLFSGKSFVLRYPVLALLGLLAFASVVKLSGIRPSKPPYMFPWSAKYSDEVDISIQANALTPENALFIVPVEFTAFRWYSKRSTYIDYKAMLHQETFLKDWYDRMQSIYQYGIKEKEGGFDLHHFSQYLLEDPSPLSIEYWKKLGITHIISTNLDLKTLTQVAHNRQFAIYKL